MQTLDFRGFRGQDFDQLKKLRKIGKKSSFYRILEKRSPETLDFTGLILPMKELFHLLLDGEYVLERW